MRGYLYWEAAEIFDTLLREDIEEGTRWPDEPWRLKYELKDIALFACEMATESLTDAQLREDGFDIDATAREMAERAHDWVYARVYPNALDPDTEWSISMYERNVGEHESD